MKVEFVDTKEPPEILVLTPEEIEDWNYIGLYVLDGPKKGLKYMATKTGESWWMFVGPDTLVVDVWNDYKSKTEIAEHAMKYAYKMELHVFESAKELYLWLADYGVKNERHNTDIV